VVQASQGKEAAATGATVVVIGHVGACVRGVVGFVATILPAYMFPTVEYRGMHRTIARQDPLWLFGS